MPPKLDKPERSENLELRLDGVHDEVTDLLEDIRHTNKLGFDACVNQSKRSLFKVRLSRLDSTFEKFMQLIRDAKQLSKQLEARDYTRYDGIRNEARALYYEALDYSDEPSSLSTTERTSTLDVTSNSVMRLPIINLPSFNGDIAEWATFKDTYVSLIHENRDLLPVQKFHYLL